MLTKLFNALMKHILILGVVLLSTSVQATVYEPFSLGYEFPAQGVALNTETQVLLEISEAPAWSSGMAILTVTPFPYVVPSSNADNLQVERQITFGAGEGALSVSIPVNVLDNGEYDVRVEVTLETEQGQLVEVRDFSVVAEDNKAWFGVDSVKNCILVKIQTLLESQGMSSTNSEFEAEFIRRFDEVVQNRVDKSWENTNPDDLLVTRRTSRILPSIEVGEQIIFTAKWKGPDNNNNLIEFPMHGVKITIRDKTGISPPIDREGYLVNGEFKFHAPYKNYRFKAIVEAKFAGINSDGSIDSKAGEIIKFGEILGNPLNIVDEPGNGTGHFEVLLLHTLKVFNKVILRWPHRQFVKDTQSYAGTIGVIDPAIVNNQTDSSVIETSPNDFVNVHKYSYVFSTKNTTFRDSADVWSVFHGMAEMVLQTKRQLDVDKDKGFEVFFPTLTGKTNREFNGNINIGWKNRHNWDVIAHEFGHSIAAENDVTKGSHGGYHNGRNQYEIDQKDKDGNSRDSKVNTYHHKANSLALAFSEGFATWFGMALLEESSYKNRFQNVGDKKYKIYDMEDNKYKLKQYQYYYGEDTERAVHNLLWDLYDSENEPNIHALCTDCKDNTSLGLNGVWNILDGGELTSISDFWHRLVEKAFNSTIDKDETKNDFLKYGKETIPHLSLRQILNVTPTFVEFGIAPILTLPFSKEINLDDGTIAPSFNWGQMNKSSLKLDRFTLALYSSDLKTLVFKNSTNMPNDYFLEDNDLKLIKDKVYELSPLPESLTAVLIGESEPNSQINGDVVSGPYFSNPVKLPVKYECPPSGNRRREVRSETENVIYLNMDSCPVDDYANQKITRASSITQIFDKFNIPSRFELDTSFASSLPSDVDNTNPYYEYIATAHNKGIVESYTTGDLTGQYAPSNPVTRVEFIEMVLETLNEYFGIPLEAEWMQEPINVFGNPFPDVDDTAWYYKYLIITDLGGN
jgi:hypothetical protein